VIDRKFKVGDFVKTENGSIGIVAWTENKYINCPLEAGCLGIDLQTHSRGFVASVKEDKCVKSSISEIVDWYGNKVKDAERRLHDAQFKKIDAERLRKENDALKNLLSVVYL